MNTAIKTHLQDNTGELDIQWYLLNGKIENLDFEFDNEEWGLEIETGRVIDPDGCPVTEGDWLEIAVLRMFELAK